MDRRGEEVVEVVFRNVLGNLVNYYLFDKINRKGKVEESI